MGKNHCPAGCLLKARSKPGVSECREHLARSVLRQWGPYKEGSSGELSEATEQG